MNFAHLIFLTNHLDGLPLITLIDIRRPLTRDAKVSSDYSGTLSDVKTYVLWLITINATPIPYESEVKNLGVWIIPDLTWDEHFSACEGFCLARE